MRTRLYENASPQLHSPKWNTSRQYNTRTRTILGVIITMLMSLALLNHYSSARTNLHVRDELDNHDVHQHKFQKPPPTAHDPESILTDALSPESSLGNDIPTAQVSSTPIVANATLDFGKIYVLNLETRED